MLYRMQRMPQGLPEILQEAQAYTEAEIQGMVFQGQESFYRESVVAGVKTLKKKIVLPIYEADVWLVVTDDVHAGRMKMKDLFGEPPDDDSYSAISSNDGAGTFGMFFGSKRVTVNHVAHEVFHVTHRILEWTSSNFDPDHHEQGAMLNAYLMDWVMKETKGYRRQ